MQVCILIIYLTAVVFSLGVTWNFAFDAKFLSWCPKSTCMQNFFKILNSKGHFKPAIILEDFAKHFVESDSFQQSHWFSSSWNQSNWLLEIVL